MALDILNTIMEVLKQTKENGELALADSLGKKVLEILDLVQTDENFIIDRTQRIALAKLAVEQGASIGEIVELLTWKDFEGFVASILTANSYQCVESFRRRGNSLMHGMEIDVIGVKGTTIITIDAKMWGIRSGKASALKKAAEKQKTRTKELSEELDRLAKKMGKLSPKEYQLLPVIVTWLVEEVELHEGVPVVPIFKLNSFILDFDQYEDLIVCYVGHHHMSSE
ncbi:MAG: hypothetical protein ThorAB25_12010 [Candidatus Thorarchaeota archaeon AB_25]|nr:MAG: hypothetical protein ThorAB25_12010 [Candidatus Thorarchaeota archaeon AB_25]